MAEPHSTVFVLGAGFTRAFLPRAPLLICSPDGIGLDELKASVQSLPVATALIEDALRRNSGQLNLEYLLTRASGQMPYDGTAVDQLRILERQLKRLLLRRLSEAAEEIHGEKVLRAFASHCVETQSSIVTFNYDDLIDRMLFKHWPSQSGLSLESPAEPKLPFRWTPEGGYGFLCKPTEHLINECRTEIDITSMYLLKLHGSINWRMCLGATRPLSVTALMQHSSWWTRWGFPGLKLELVERFLDSEPFIVPPVLTKHELVSEPVLQLMWSYARYFLERAQRIVFIGYSLPLTDIAARFLFDEAINRDGKPRLVEVVTLASDDNTKSTAKQAYEQLFGGRQQLQFHFDGAVRWLSETIAVH